MVAEQKSPHGEYVRRRVCYFNSTVSAVSQGYRVQVSIVGDLDS